jgi:hypothetical protein
MFIASVDEITTQFSSLYSWKLEQTEMRANFYSFELIFDFTEWLMAPSRHLDGQNVVTDSQNFGLQRQIEHDIRTDAQTDDLESTKHFHLWCDCQWC